MPRAPQVYKEFLQWIPKQDKGRQWLAALFLKVSDPDVPAELSHDQLVNALAMPGEFAEEDLELYRQAEQAHPAAQARFGLGPAP